MFRVVVAFSCVEALSQALLSRELLNLKILALGCTYCKPYMSLSDIVISWDCKAVTSTGFDDRSATTCELELRCQDSKAASHVDKEVYVASFCLGGRMQQKLFFLHSCAGAG